MTIPKNTFLKIIYTAIIIGAGFFSEAYCQDVSTNQYKLTIKFIDKDSLFTGQELHLQTNFKSQLFCADYINKLRGILNTQGYLAASVDAVNFDSAAATIQLYLGLQQKWVKLNTDSIDKKALDESGFFSKNFTSKPFNPTQVQVLKERVLNYYEKSGYPFAAVYLDSIRLQDETINAILKVNSGPLYHIDSIRVNGKVKIASHFLQRYLGIVNGSIYNKDKLDQVEKKLMELPFLQEQQPSELQLLGTGAVLNLYLQPKPSSQLNFLIGFLPANNQTNKLQITGDVNLNLKNALGKAETILLNWQQLQIQSPRLNIGYQQPFIFKSAFGIDVAFNLFKKDSSFLQVNTQLGLQYLLSANQSGKIFFQQQNSILLASGVDTNLVKITKRLPANIDVNVSNIGIDYDWSKTNYRNNPRSGNEIKIISSVGLRTISKNNDIVSIGNSTFNYASLYDSLKLKTYQLRTKLIGSHYFPLGKVGTLKATLNAGLISSPNIFRNELFQIGGFKLLRGFDEESIFATRYVVATAEFRQLLGLNSYLFAFTDAAWVKNKYQYINTSNNFISAGIGMVFETKLGLLNLIYAVGKRDDVNFDFGKGSKIHFGYVNYF